MTLGRIKEPMTPERFRAIVAWIATKRHRYFGRVIVKRPILVAITDNEGQSFHPLADEDIKPFNERMRIVLPVTQLEIAL